MVMGEMVGKVIFWLQRQSALWAAEPDRIKIELLPCFLPSFCTRHLNSICSAGDSLQSFQWVKADASTALVSKSQNVLWEHHVRKVRDVQLLGIARKITIVCSRCCTFAHFLWSANSIRHIHLRNTRQADIDPSCDYLCSNICSIIKAALVDHSYFETLVMHWGVR